MYARVDVDICKGGWHLQEQAAERRRKQQEAAERRRKELEQRRREEANTELDPKLQIGKFVDIVSVGCLGKCYQLCVLAGLAGRYSTSKY